MINPFLKWPGGKRGLLSQILPHLQGFDTFVEPFCGSGVVFLNAPNKKRIIADINQDLINLFRFVKDEKSSFINFCEKLFVNSNESERYYAHREEFNATTDLRKKSALFLYLNKHGFNGLVRYNHNGKLNVAFGKYKAVSFPRKEMEAFCDAVQNVELHCCSFEKMFELIDESCVVYCDPPYDVLTETSNFTSYSKSEFGKEQQKQLAELVMSSKAKVIASNHDTKFIREIYAGCEIISVEVPRRISVATKERTPAREVIIVTR